MVLRSFPHSKFKWDRSSDPLERIQRDTQISTRAKPGMCLVWKAEISDKTTEIPTHTADLQASQGPADPIVSGTTLLSTGELSTPLSSIGLDSVTIFVDFAVQGH
jgi:hypothetical protein